MSHWKPDTLLLSQTKWNVNKTVKHKNEDYAKQFHLFFLKFQGLHACVVQLLLFTK